MIPPLNVEGSLQIDVDGTPATLTGAGDAVVLRTDSPAAVIHGAGVAGGRLDAVAQTLTAAGLRLVVEGPRGPVATLGVGVASPVGRVLAGSARVRLGAPGAVLPIARARAGRGLRRHPWRTVVVGGVAVAVGYVVYRASTSDGGAAG